MMPYVFVALFGAVIGSFLNVCIYRMPRGESVAWPGSHCPACGHEIAPYDNIPVVSYLVLRGRCRACGIGISPQYPLVEAVNALGFVLMFWLFGFGPAALVYSLFFSALLVITGTDLSHQIIPDAITLPGLALGLLAAWLILPSVSSTQSLESLLGEASCGSSPGSAPMSLARRGWAEAISSLWRWLGLFSVGSPSCWRS